MAAEAYHLATTSTTAQEHLVYALAHVYTIINTPSMRVAQSTATLCGSNVARCAEKRTKLVEASSCQDSCRLIDACAAEIPPPVVFRVVQSGLHSSILLVDGAGQWEKTSCPAGKSAKAPRSPALQAERR